MTNKARTSTWDTNPRHWFEDIGIPVKQPVREEDLPPELGERLPARKQLLADQLTKALEELDQVSRTSWWWAVLIALPGVGFAVGVFTRGAQLESAGAATFGEAAAVWLVVGSGVAAGLLAAVLFARWTLSTSGLLDRWLGGILAAATVLLIASRTFGFSAPEEVQVAFVIAYLVVIVLAPGIVIGQLVQYLLARNKVRRHSQEHYAVALLCGLVTGAARAAADGGSPRDAAHQKRMLWGIEDLARTVAEERSTRLFPGDPRTRQRQTERASRRAEAIRYWKDHVLEPGHHSVVVAAGRRRMLLPGELSTVLEFVLDGDWGALPEASSTEVGPGWRDWVGALLAVLGAVGIYYAIRAINAGVTGDAFGGEDLLAQVGTLTPVLAVAWAWFLVPPSVKQVLATRLAGLKELKELQ